MRNEKKSHFINGLVFEKQHIGIMFFVDNVCLPLQNVGAIF